MRNRIMAVIAAVALLVAGGVLFAGPSTADSAGFKKIDTYYVQGPYYKQIPIGRTASPLYDRIGIRTTVTVRPGDIVQVSATTQISSKHTTWVMVGRYIAFGAKPISRRFTTNVYKGIHHLPVTTVATYKAENAGTFYVTQFLYSASSNATSTWRLTVDYAEMHITVFRV